jgi:hypothetical protein
LALYLRFKGVGLDNVGIELLFEGTVLVLDVVELHLPIGGLCFVHVNFFHVDTNLLLKG